MSLNYTIGDLLLQGLDDYGISSQTIREGVLTAKKFSKIEHDEGLGDRMIWDFLLERMSVSPLIYKCYITKDEETLLQKRKVLRSITDELRSIPLNATQQQLEKQKKLLKKGKLLVFDYSSAWQNTDAVIQGSGRIHDLFVQVIYGWLLKTALTQKSNTVLFYTECTSSTLEIMYLAHLRKTWKTLHSVSIEEWCKNGHYFLAELELELIYLTSDALLYNQHTSDAKEILEWLCRPFLFACMQKRNKESIRILPLAAVKLAELEFIEGNIKQAWDILEQTKRLMKREQNNGAIWLILNCQKNFISASRNTQFSVQEKILNEYKKYDFIVNSSAINPYAIWESSTDNHIWISNDVIRNARLQKGFTQHQACEGIIEPETYSRFESGKSRLRWEKQKLLLERLGQSSARVQFIVDSPHPKVLVTAKNILTDIQLGRLNMANEKYIELSCWLTKSSVNDKFNQLVTDQLDSMF